MLFLLFSLVCPVNVQQFILRDASLLPRANVIATSEDATNNPGTNFIETTSPPWCTAEGEGVNGRRNYVELTFTEQIVVEFFESSGLLESWVSNFSIEYSQTVSGEDFVAYGVLETPQVFTYLYVCIPFNKITKQQSCYVGANVRVLAFYVSRRVRTDY